ncbi:hypothetical protein C8J57DRAFT_1351812, partial [Mycena rebaudengoi]
MFGSASYHVLAQPCWSQLLLVSSLSVPVHVNLVASYNLRTMPLQTPSLIRTQTPKLRARGIEFLDLAVLERICGQPPLNGVLVWLGFSLKLLNAASKLSNSSMRPPCLRVPQALPKSTTCSSAPPSNFKLRKVSYTQIVNIPYSTSALQARIHATVLSAHSPPHCAGHQPFLGDE